jgi:arabinogalactan oligomer/maltooligosaccharide transport system permease protein
MRLMSSPAAGFDIWMQGWLIGPGAMTLLWVSSRPVSAWSTRRLSLSAVEYGLERNQRYDHRLRSAGAHLVLLHFVALTLLPLVWIIDIALSPGNALGGSLGGPYTGEHFSNMLGSEAFWTWMRNSLIVSVGTTLMGLAVAIPAGYAFSRYKFTGRDVSMFAFLLVQMFPGIIILVPYFLVMKTLGLLNSHLGLILAYCVTALPLCVWMLKGFFDTVPRELEEAALLDGCTQFQVFTKVVLPLSLPAVAVTALFSFLAAWNEFLLALTFNTSNDMYTLPVGLASMISSTGQAWGDFAAASLLVSLPVALLFLFFQKFLIEGLSAGGVKG